MKPEEFTQLINLASDRLGTKELAVSDEFFAPAENLFKPGRGVFIEGKYTDRGKWMDGWESRRKRVPGHDWCVIKLGLRGVIRGVDIDTNHFLGNHPPIASIEAADCEHIPTDKDWVEILKKSPLKPGSQNLFSILTDKPWTHIRLNIYPDGGVARLKVYGEVVPNWNGIKPGELVDLAAVRNGGVVLAANDTSFSPKENLILPGRGLHMGDGWETRRKREPGYDWVVVKLGRPGVVKQVEVDTCHFKGNYPDSFSLEGTFTSDGNYSNAKWEELIAKHKLESDRQHYFMEKDIKSSTKVTHVRLNIFPDGGVSRLRVLGAFE